MSGDDSAQTLPLQGGMPAQRPRRRRGWAWIIAFAIVVVLAVAAWFVGEWIARDVVVKTIRTQITTNLDLPADQEIDVEVPGAVLPQLISGSLDEVQISSEDVALQSFEGDIAAEAFDVPIRGGSIRDATAVVTIDETQLRRLMSSVDGFPADALGIDEPDVTATIDLDLFGASVPVGVSLTPGTDEGELLLTPAAVRVAGADVTADELRRQFGILSNAVLRDWPVCITEYLPAGLTLADVAVHGDELVARFTIADDILDDPALQQNGTC